MNIKINLHKINHQLEKKIYKKIHSDILFSKIHKTYREILQTHFSNIPYKIIKSLRAEYVKNKIIIKYYRVKINELIPDYLELTMTELTKKYDLPPIILIKMIYKNRKYKKNEIDDIINGNTKKLTEYDIKQLNDALKQDAFTLLDTKKQLEKSIIFEKKVESFLQKHNLKYKTQEDLTKEDIKIHGRPVSTPDFLLIDELYINGVKINWIDAKNYYISCTQFTTKKIKKQIQKYINLYGTGAIITSVGVCDDVFFNDTIVIPFNDIKLYEFN